MAQGVYAALTRQVGLLREIDVVAQNIANASTTGFRAESLVFSEFVKGNQDGSPSLSMARAHGRILSETQGGLEQTGGTFDFAIEGAGFFQVEGPDGPLLTRAGAFATNDASELVTMEGRRVLDAGGAPIFIPANAGTIHLASDGTLSADDQPLALIGLVTPIDPTALQRASGTTFKNDGDVEPVLNPRVLQGFLEGSNVEPVNEIARMIEVQHAYQAGQSFLEREDDRLRSITRLMEG